LKILGIDPGTQVTGYGVVEKRGSELVHIADGSIKLGSADPLAERLLVISDAIDGLVAEYAPDAVAVESVFFAKNARSALTLGHARGVVLLCAARHGLEVFEYAPRTIKLAVTGYGNAEKDQVQKMVAMLLGGRMTEGADASDALAIAVCHINHQRPGAQSARRAGAGGMGRAR